MKKTMIATALLASISTVSFADTATSEASPPPPTPAPVQETTEPTAPVVQQTLDCNYHIAADANEISQTIITKWAEKAAVQSFTFSPDSFQNQLERLKVCFTDKGWTSFNDALDKSGNIKAIQNQRLTVSSQMEGAASFAAIKDNRWKVTIPMEVVYQNSNDKITQALKVDLLIGRKISGDLGIMQVIATPKQTPENSADTPEVKPDTTTAPKA